MDEGMDVWMRRWSDKWVDGEMGGWVDGLTGAFQQVSPEDGGPCRGQKWPLRGPQDHVRMGPVGAWTCSERLEGAAKANKAFPVRAEKKSISD